MTLNLRAGGRNGERIELFVNSRRAEALGDDIFLNSESVRQMTLGGPTLRGRRVATSHAAAPRPLPRRRRGHGRSASPPPRPAPARRQNPTVPRVVIGEYQSYFTWRRDGDAARCNVLTAVYAVPGGPLFEEAFDRPLVVYSHNVRLERTA